MNEAGVVPGRGVRTLWGVVRILFALVLVAAVATQFEATYTNAVAKGRDLTTVIVNFFSFFTMLSNLFTAIALLVGGLWLLTRGRTRQWEPRGLSFVLVAVSTYMVITGIVYNALLRSAPITEPISVPWANEVLHLVCPLFMLIELVWAIARRPLPWTVLGFSMIFPLVWIAYSLWRGSVVSNPETGAPYWYPYPFLDPFVQPNGYFGVGLYIVVIAAVVMLIAAAGVARTRTRRRLQIAAAVLGAEAAEPEPDIKTELFSLDERY